MCHFEVKCLFFSFKEKYLYKDDRDFLLRKNNYRKMVELEYSGSTHKKLRNCAFLKMRNYLVYKLSKV